MPASKEILANLLEWCDNEGATHDSRISFEYSVEKGISTLYKGDRTEPQQFKLSVPRHLILTGDTAWKFFREEIPGFTSELSSVVLLTAYIAFHRYDPRPYFQMLPLIEEIRSPLTYTDTELEMLANTNLYNGTKVKKEQVKREWELVRADTKGFRDLTFDDFLWGHLILSSRAFPYKIVDKDADPRSVMLLPLVDLMNHQPMSKAKWWFDGQAFNVEVESQEQEICNNYGPKGNEELLEYYGFVLEDNRFDCLQLSLGKPGLVNLIGSADMHQWGVKKLPKLDDYTYSVVTNVYDTPKVVPGVSDDDEFVVYMCNHDNPLPEGLLELFSLICRRPGEEGPTLTSVLNGINKLRQSLEFRFKGKLDVMPAKKEGVLDLNYDNCRIYRAGQLKVYNEVKRALKEKEKVLLKTHKHSLVTIKHIQKDPQFEPFLELYQMTGELSQFQQELAVRLWLLKEVNYGTTQWITDEFAAISEVQESQPFLEDMYNQAIVPLTTREELADLVQGSHWDIPSFVKVDELYNRNSYEKGSKQEPVLIAPAKLTAV